MTCKEFNIFLNLIWGHKMKKYLCSIIFIAMLFLAGCSDIVNPGEKSEETIIINGCTYKNLDVSPLVGLSEYTNIESAQMCEEYVDILVEMSIENGFRDNTIIYYDEKELVFLNGNGVFYRYKNNVLEEHDVFDNLFKHPISTPGSLGYDPSKSLLFAIERVTMVYGSSNVSLIVQYDMNKKEAKRHPLDLGRDPKFVHAGFHGSVIDTWDKLFVFNEKFELLLESSDHLFLGSSKYYSDKDNEVILIGKNNENTCEVTLYRGSSETNVTLEDSCNTVQRLDVLSKYVYFVINKKLYKYDAEENLFQLVPLLTQDDGVDYLVTDHQNGNNQIQAMKLSKGIVTFFNKNIDITQSTDAVEVYQVGETFYLAEKPNSNDIYVYDFNRTEMLKIEEDFVYTSMSYNHLVLNKVRCELMYCQNIYKNGVELVLSDVMLFNAMDNKHAIYADQVTDSSYDVMHVNFETNVTKKIMTLPYSTSPYTNYSSLVTLPNGMFMIRDGFTGFYHHYDIDGEFIETTQYIGYYKTIRGASIIYLLRDNGEVIALNYYL